MNDLFCDKEKILESILYESENFMVVVGKGIITPGHVMLIPKDHYNAFAELPNGLMYEFNEIKNNLIQNISKYFSKPYLVEHGNCRQSVSHAHIHFIPKNGEGYEIKNIYEEIIAPSNLPFETGDFKKLKEIYSKEGGYISIEDDKLYVFKAKKFSFEEQNKIVYRRFFVRNGVLNFIAWKDMDYNDIKNDNIKRDLTKKILKVKEIDHYRSIC